MKQRVLSPTQINEATYQGPYSNEAYEFARDILKMGSRDNLFDKFMKKRGIVADELSTFVGAVIKELETRWQ